MAKKGKIEKPKREVTKRQLSQWQQQRRRERIIRGIGISIIVAVFGIVGVGWYISQYQPLHQTVIKVNDTKFDMNYYVKMLKLYGGGQPSYYMYVLADEVVKRIEENELMRQGAMELGISVSNKEVDKELKSYDPPLSKDYRDVIRIEMLISRLGDEYFEVPLFAGQRHIMAMLLESEGQATEVRARLESGEEFGELAGELSLESLSQARNGDLGWHPKDVLAELLPTSTADEYAFSAEIGVLSQPIYDETIMKTVGYWLIEVLEREEESEEAQVQAVLLASEQQAQAVKARLEAGEDFATLAKELSQHDASKESGGDLDWLTPGTMSPAFDEFVFDPEVKLETLSEPVRDDTVVTTEGYWLLTVLDKDDNKEISSDDRDWLKGMALNEWVSSLWDDPENEIDHSYLDDEKKAWAIAKAIES